MVQLNKNEFLSGEKVICNVKVSTRSPIKVRSLEIEFYGRFYAEIQVTRSSGKNTYTETIIDVENIFRERVFIEGEKQGGTDWNMWEPGNYEFTEEFQLPENIPPSFPFDEFELNKAKGRVEYGVEVKLDKVHALDPHQKVHFFVDNLTYITSNLNFSETEYINTVDSKKPSIKINLDKAQYRAGDTINGTIAFDKQGETGSIRNVSLSLRNVVSRYVYSYSPVESDYYKEVINLGNEERFKAPFTFKIPDYAIPCIHSRVLIIYWEIHVKVDIALRYDVNLRIPILLGAPECQF